MQRKSFGQMPCPIARGLDRVGEWWSMLILRDAFAGISRFDDFQQSLGIAPGMLTRRLNALASSIRGTGNMLVPSAAICIGCFGRCWAGCSGWCWRLAAAGSPCA